MGNAKFQSSGYMGNAKFQSSGYMGNGNLRLNFSLVATWATGNLD